ncbi:unnamed protein product [Clonostachys solani]|uniref:RWD domain-containing protein n=1 Tax=Clonostachys solani TaxID=160281 RepID=A0A9N9ZP56_9HYPO|nr:unnamed protein product [Clonostachys solani]
MSEELQDEVEAINSIYGEGTLSPASEDSSEYILNLPGGASSLRLRFPAPYPEAPPEVLGTHHSSGGRKGAGARDLALFVDALGNAFQPGVVCLFDSVEEFSRRYEEEVAAVVEEEEGLGEAEHEDGGEPELDLASLPTPPWTLSELIVDSRSTFLAHVAPVRSPEQARLYVAQLLASDRRIRSATHNMTAWRIRGEGGASYQDCDDDGETAAGGRLLHLMQLMELWDAMVVVTRWYGGVKLGPRRFAVINAAARDGFVRAGMVVEKDKEKDKKKGK